MYKKVFRIFCSIILLGAVINCGKDDAPVTGNLNLYNDTSYPISELYVTPSLEAKWGPNHLDSPLPSGASYTLSEHIGTYDAKATIIGELSTYYGHLNSIVIGADTSYNWHVYDSDFSGSLKIVNHSTAGSYISEIYVSPTGSGSWGPNLITSVIPPNDSKHLYDISPGDYDIRIVWNAPPDSFYNENIISSLTLLTLDVD